MMIDLRSNSSTTMVGFRRKLFLQSLLKPRRVNRYKSTSSLKRKTRKNTTKIEDLSDDIVTEILIRLPFREAHRCKAVSKRWFSLISSPHFTRKYTSLNDSNDKFFIMYHIVGYDITRAFYFNHGIIASAKESTYYEVRDNEALMFLLYNFKFGVMFLLGDLVLIKSMKLRAGNRLRLYMYNVLTKQSLILPSPPHGPLDQNADITSFMGCVRSKDDPTQYKVVLVQSRHTNNGQGDEVSTFLDIFVYSPKDNSWSEFSVLAPPNIAFREMYCIHKSECATIYNGKLFWTNNMIIGYDPFTNPNECEFIDFPDQFRIDNIDRVCIANVQGRIRLYDSRITSASTLSFWDLTDYPNRVWTRMSVDLSGTHWRDITGSIAQPTKIRGFNPFDEVVYVMLSNCSILAIHLKSVRGRNNTHFKSSFEKIIVDMKLSEEVGSTLYLVAPPSWPTPLR